MLSSHRQRFYCLKRKSHRGDDDSWRGIDLYDNTVEMLLLLFLLWCEVLGACSRVPSRVCFLAQDKSVGNVKRKGTNGDLVKDVFAVHNASIKIQVVSGKFQKPKKPKAKSHMHRNRPSNANLSDLKCPLS